MMLKMAAKGLSHLTFNEAVLKALKARENCKNLIIAC